MAFLHKTLIPELEYLPPVMEPAIPLDDLTAWKLYPNHRFCYDNIWLANYNKQKWGPNGIFPEEYPVIQKPILNLYGHGLGVQKISCANDFEPCPGSIWTEYAEGQHLIIDVPVSEGRIRDWFIAEATHSDHGRVSYWRVHCHEEMNFLDQKKACISLIEEKFQSLTGFVSIEFIGKSIVDVHLHFTVPFITIYGDEFIKRLSEFYKTGSWSSGFFKGFKHTEAFSIPVWLDKWAKFTIDEEELKRISKAAQLISFCQYYKPNLKKTDYLNPPKSFKLGVINIKNIDHGFDFVKSIKHCFA